MSACECVCVFVKGVRDGVHRGSVQLQFLALAHHLVQLGRLGPALDYDDIDGAANVLVPHRRRGVRVGGDQDIGPVALVELFQPRGQVDTVTCVKGRVPWAVVRTGG